MAVVIKNVDERRWRRFKAEAARRGERLGDLFNHLVDRHLSYEGEAERSWGRILHDAPFLSEEDAREMRKSSERFRHRFRMR